MYRHILIPTDGREGTERAIDEAIELARDQGATLHVLYVVNSTSIAPGVDFEDLSVIGRQAVEYVTDRAQASGVDTVETAVTHGVRHKAILKYAREHGIDLVVMGQNRRSENLFRRSVSKQVSDAASVPVLIVD